MKLLHTSDWHFGMSVGSGSYEEDQRFFLNQLYDLIRREQVEGVLLAGDVYDTGVANAAAIELYNEAVTTLCGGMGIPVVVIAGNHDSAARLAACRRLLQAAGLYVTGKLTRPVEPVLLDGGRVAVYPLPYFNADEVKALFPEERSRIRSQETAVQVVCDEIRRSMDPGRVNIALSHALIVQAELSESDRSARVGFATAVSKDVFAGFDYVALGHIHKPQQISERIRYSGSPMAYSFGSEELQEKGVVLLDTDTGEQTFVPLKPMRPRATVRGTYEELIARTDLAEAYLRLEVTDRYAGLELWADLQGRFPQLLELRGKGLEENETLTALTVDQLQTLDETDIMMRFLAEHFDYTPTQSQIDLFREAAAVCDTQGED